MNYSEIILLFDFCFCCQNQLTYAVLRSLILRIVYVKEFSNVFSKEVDSSAQITTTFKVQWMSEEFGHICRP